MRSTFCLFAFLFLTCLCTSQTDNPHIDSLIQKANFYNYKNQDSSLFYSKKAHSLAKTKQDTFLIAAAGYYYSFYLISSNLFEEAIAVLNFNITHSKVLPEVLMGNTFYNLGSISYLKEVYDDAIENYLVAQDYYSVSSNKKGLARTQLQLSIIYNKLGDTEMENYFANLSLESSQNNEHGTTKITTEEKIELLQKRLTTTPALSDKIKSMLLYSLARNYFENGATNEAISYFKKSLSLKEKIGFTNLTVETKVYIAEGYLLLKEYREALEVVSNLTYSEKRKSPLKIENIFTEAHKGLGNYEEALFHNQKLSFLQDSINALDENIKIANITAKYNTAEKEKQIISLQKENEIAFLEVSTHKKNWIIALIISLILLATTVWFIKRWRGSEKRIALVEEQKNLIEQKVEAQHLLLKSKSKVYLKDLHFVKSDGNYVEFHSISKKTLEREKLKEVLEKLPPNFVRVHRSYIVNKNQIKSFNSSTVFLKSGHEIPLSRTYKENL